MSQNYSSIVAADKVLGYKEMYEQLKARVDSGEVGGAGVKTGKLTLKNSENSNSDFNFWGLLGGSDMFFYVDADTINQMWALPEGVQLFKNGMTVDGATVLDILDSGLIPDVPDTLDPGQSYEIPFPLIVDFAVFDSDPDYTALSTIEGDVMINDVDFDGEVTRIFTIIGNATMIFEVNI